MLPYQYAYLFTDLVIGLPLWLAVFYFRKDLRHKIIVFSIFGAIAGPFSELWYIKDYWHPILFNGWAIGVEDVLFGAFAGGVGSVLYEELFVKRFVKRYRRTNHWILLIFPLAMISLLVWNRFFSQFHLNSIYTSSIAFMITALFIFVKRRDLFFDSLMTGIICGSIFFFGYLFLLVFFPFLFEKMWLLHNISGVRVLKIPVEELLWAFTYGLMIGPIYECYAGLTFVRRIQKKHSKKR